jgi:uncharacterized protein (DUF433 family)
MAAQEYGRIVRTEDMMDGEPRIEGRRITVLRIHDLVEQRGLPAPEVADMHDLDPATVYHALAYYHANPNEMEAVRTQRDEKIQRSLDEGADTLASVREAHADGDAE